MYNIFQISFFKSKDVDMRTNNTYVIIKILDVIYATYTKSFNGLEYLGKEENYVNTI